jgi:hypothetical protein
MFSARREWSTVSVTVKHSVITFSSRCPAAQEDAMTKAKLVFDPFSEEFFNNPFETYRRMREEAPLY